MWCLVSQPNAVILEVEVDPKAKGQECLEKVCECLGIQHESDYFGLKFHNHKGDELWLNLRNPIERQVSGLPPHRFALRVKFWVPPHLLLQESTRHQFYLQARQWLSTLSTLATSGEGDNHSTEIAALVARADAATATLTVTDTNSAVSGAAAAEYWLLKEVSQVPGWGEELFHSSGPSVGVGPHGLTIYGLGDKEIIPYYAVVSACTQRRQFRLCFVTSAQPRTLDLKFDSSQAAVGLYRALTEKHVFYSCETVRSAVSTQSIRDLKGTIASIFNEDSTLGLKYVFDIRRTCREVYDAARRSLYQSGDQERSEAPDGTEGHPLSTTTPTSTAATLDQAKPGNGQSHSCSMCSGCKCSESREKLSRVLEAMACRICMDRSIDTAFFPCAHVMCCSECADRCVVCPLCRGTIEKAQRIYLPVELTPGASSAPSSSSTVSSAPTAPVAVRTRVRLLERHAVS